MKQNPNLVGYNQNDIEKLYSSGSITPNIDSYSNLTIQNTTRLIYSSSITMPLTNLVYNSTKVETKNNPLFYEL